jgi:hypothetical protein
MDSKTPHTTTHTDGQNRNIIIGLFVKTIQKNVKCVPFRAIIRQEEERLEVKIINIFFVGFEVKLLCLCDIDILTLIEVHVHDNICEC